MVWLHWFEKRLWALGLLLVFATMALYSPVSHHPFVNYDDTAYVTQNRHVQSGLHWNTVKWAFTSFEGGNWHPLTWLSHILDYQIFQLDPSGHHAVSVLLHILNVLLLFWVLQQATGFAGRSFMVAGLFGLHAVNVESVAWIAERKNLLSMLFFLLALGAYRRYAREPRAARYVLVALLFALGLMAKPQIITLPFVLLLWDYWPLQRMFAPAPGPSPEAASATIPPKRLHWLIVEKIPLFAISAANAVLTMQTQETNMYWYSRLLRLENAIVCYGRYLRNAFWPSDLAVVYPHPMASLGVWPVAASLTLLLAISALVAENRRHRYLTVGWLWFLGTLVPMIGLVQVGYQAMADRYAYVPYIGLFVMVCWGVADWARQKDVSAPLLAGASIVILVALGVVAHRQIGYWSDSVTLWSHAAEVTSGNWVAEDNLGTLMMFQGKIEAGIPHLRRAAAINPSDPISNLNIGFYEYQHGNLQQAIERYETVINLSSRSSQALRMQAFNNLGLLYQDVGDNLRAEQCFKAAINLSSLYQ
jgi:hypothetical protein